MKRVVKIRGKDGKLFKIELVIKWTPITDRPSTNLNMYELKAGGRWEEVDNMKKTLCECFEGTPEYDRASDRINSRVVLIMALLTKLGVVG